MSPFSPPRLWLGSGVTITLGGGGTEIQLLPPLPPQPHHIALIPSIGLIGPPIYFIGSTSELVIMGHPPLPPPPQMSNGGSPPAPLPPYISDPSWWLQFKWLQPPPRAPEWLFNYYKCYNPPANIGQLLHDKEWHNEPFAKTNRLPDCCRRGHPEGPFFMGLALTGTERK